jgi:plasmid stabilization system protein ParE
MTYKVRLTGKAERQLKDAAQWWAEHRSREQAERWYDGFLRALRSLAHNPQRCPLARENTSVPIEIRELHYGLGRRPTHRAIFAIRPDSVVVYSIRHNAQADLTADEL